MDRQQARNLIKETFETQFDKNKFTIFVKNLLNKIEENTFTYKGNIIPDSFAEYISTMERIGKYSDGEHEIDILIVQLKRETSLERARTMQRNFIAKYLNGSRGGKMKDAALVAFVSPDEKDWRFSLVKMDYRLEKTPTGRMKVKEEFTPARRWSFLVGPNEKSHTAQSRLAPLLEDDTQNPTLLELEEAFNIEKVSNEFFEKYRYLFIRTKKELDKIIKNDSVLKKEFEKNEINTVDFAKKLLGQIVFLYFLQKKGWFGVQKNATWGTGSKNFLRELFEQKHCRYKNFFNDILEPLFYEALRINRSHDDHYYSRFNCKIPFLNGGLFDPIGNYNWVNTEIVIPNELFSNRHKTPEGDIGDGILDVFDRYNFTVKEDEPLEKEVAIDPELLGKAYEKFNAIRTDNFDEYVKAIKSGNKGDENKFNKEYGVYYTPREIVHYMCQQSLIQYLHTELNQIPKEDIETLILYGEHVSENEMRVESKGKETDTYYYKLPESIRSNAQRIDELLANIKVCDPAVGSGAFPVGMMHEIVKLRQLLSIYIGKEANSYYLKRHCIEESLHGVDIDMGAVEICKLRFWLSMIVDEEDFQTIKPLPNLDYKIVCGDSLVGVERNLFNDQLFVQIEDLKPKYFNETNPTKKQELKAKIDSLISQITSGHKEFDYEVYFSEVFHGKKGFDVVIANPPYVQLQKNSGKLANLYQKKGFATFDRMGDIYCLFYEKGINITKEKGHLCFITSNKWMRAKYGEKLRKFFLQHNPKVLIDLGPGIFESATVDTNILLVQKQQISQFQLKGVTLTKDNSISIEEQIKKNGVVLEKLTKDAWFIGSSAEQRLKEKIERIGKPLKEWDVNIYRGVLTGLNEAFIITTEKRNEILAKCKTKEERKRTEAIIKPILRGRDIKRYYYEWAGLWVIVIPAGWTNEMMTSSNLTVNRQVADRAETFFRSTFPALYEHLKPYKSKAQKRDDQGDYWWELRHCAYYPEFEKEKIIYIEIMTDNWEEGYEFPSYSYWKEVGYVLNTAYIMTGDNLKYILGILNSKFGSYLVKQHVTQLQKRQFRMLAQYVNNFELPPITFSNQPIVTQIEKLVDQILEVKKSNKQADTRHLEREIDQLVYRLYELTEEEMRIIEKGV